MKMEEYPNVFVMDHPLIQHKLTFFAGCFHWHEKFP